MNDEIQNYDKNKTKMVPMYSKAILTLVNERISFIKIYTMQTTQFATETSLHTFLREDK